MIRKKYFLTKGIAFTLLLTCFCVSSFKISAQIMDQKEVPRNTYIGLSLGINDYGIGVVAESPVGYKVSLFGNVGLGGWGYKVGGGIMYYPKQAPFGPGFGLGYAYASGLIDFETELWVEPNNEEQLVMLDLNGISTINLMYSHSWAFGRSGKLSIVTGYAIKIANEPYVIKSDGVVLTSKSKRFLNFMQPGGFTLGLRLMFGFN